MTTATESSSLQAKKRILVVDDNEDFRTVLSMSLQSKGFEVTQAASGREAALTLAAQTFDVILSDIEMPELTGIQLLALLSTINCPSPLLLMTGHEPTGYLEEAKKHGVAGFLLKPFSTQFLIERLEKVLSGFRPNVSAAPLPTQAKSEEKKAGASASNIPQLLERTPVAQVQATDLQVIGLEDLFVGKVLDFDVYILDQQGRPCRIGESRREMDPHLRGAAKSGRFGEVYAVRSEYETIVMKNLGLLGSARGDGGSPPADPARQAEVLRSVQEKALARLKCESVDPRLFRLCWSLSEVTLGIAVRQPGLALFVDDLLNPQFDSLARAIGASVYSLLVCYQLGWRSPATLYKISFASIIHDVGLVLVPESVRLKPDSQREIPERDDFERHPLHGVKLLRDIGLVSEEFTQIVAQHHENRLGTGYPMKLREQGIFPLARVTALANQFVDSILGGPGCAPQKVTDAWALMVGPLRQSFSPQVLQGLGEVIGAPPESFNLKPLGAK